MAFDFKLDPFENLDDQLNFAEVSGIKEPTAMSLATASKNGRPSLRVVLFKGVLRGGISFFTNYDSPKAQDLIENPNAEVLFYWANIFQQIRIAGSVEKLTRAESEAYFSSRPRLSQIGAWASQQSTPISSYQELQNRVDDFDFKFSSLVVPCPPNWGGFILIPEKFEFWFGKEGRLHERYRYRRSNTKSEWIREMLSP
jgi:pyridoxamine 5'-phosphate oxidase